MTLVPPRMDFQNGHVKVAIALAKGKQAHDKRETIKRREADDETARPRRSPPLKLQASGTRDRRVPAGRLRSSGSRAGAAGGPTHRSDRRWRGQKEAPPPVLLLEDTIFVASVTVRWRCAGNGEPASWRGRSPGRWLGVIGMQTKPGTRKVTGASQWRGCGGGGTFKCCRQHLHPYAREGVRSGSDPGAALASRPGGRIVSHHGQRRGHGVDERNIWRSGAPK